MQFALEPFGLEVCCLAAWQDVRAGTCLGRTAGHTSEVQEVRKGEDVKTGGRKNPGHPGMGSWVGRTQAEVLLVGDLGPQKAAELAVLVEKEVEQVGELVVAAATFGQKV